MAHSVLLPFWKTEHENIWHKMFSRPTFHLKSKLSFLHRYVPRLDRLPTALKTGLTSSQWLDARSLYTQQWMGTWWKHWGNRAARKGSGHPTSQSWLPRTSVLSLKALPQCTDRIWDLPLLFVPRHFLTLSLVGQIHRYYTLSLPFLSLMNHTTILYKRTFSLSDSKL